MNNCFDVIVVGGGHAGIEAAWAAARMGSTTALVSLELEKIGTMPCNPAVGGIGKGHLVFELSAMGGLMPQLCSSTYLQARMLNTRKGPAVQGLRLQIDKNAYSKLSQERLKQADNLTLIEGRVDQITTEGNRITGIVLHDGRHLQARSVVLTTGTFLNGTIHIGQLNYEGGRRGEKGVTTLPAFFKEQGITTGRLKTGTPPRLLTTSLDFSVMEKQDPDELSYLFEFYPQAVTSSHACYITHTNETTHQIIRDNLGRSAMYSGNIKGIGPRYCPSIEDKISRFAHKSSHHIFVEPEDASEQEVYPNGLSTSLPADVQEQYIRSIKGFEQAVITKLGYAIEYDFVNPRQLDHSLALKAVEGLYLAGQINGTTGYEEAACQGLVAGINAHLKAHDKQPCIFERTHSYIGVMIDDLITMGVDEPYRMFTSRAERRLYLRQDNAFERLTPTAYALGLIDQKLFDDFCAEQTTIKETVALLKATYNQAQLQQLCEQNGNLQELINKHAPQPLGQRACVTVQAECLYEPYLKRESFEVERREQYKTMRIPTGFAIRDLPGLSKELQEKITRYAPATIADAALIPGMTPAAISLLIFKIREYTKRGIGKAMMVLLLLGMSLGLHAQTRIITFQNNLSALCGLDDTFTPYKPTIESLHIAVRSANNQWQTSTQPFEDFSLEIEDNKIEVVIYHLPTALLFLILPPEYIIGSLQENAGFMTRQKHNFKYMCAAVFKKLCSHINVTLHTTIDPDESYVHFTDIIIDFIELAQHDNITFQWKPLKTVCLSAKN